MLVGKPLFAHKAAELLEFVRGAEVIAHNATFERTCIGTMLNETLDPSQWECTMVQCARCGLPLSLGEAAKALGLEAQKMTEGKKLIKQFWSKAAFR